MSDSGDARPGLSRLLQLAAGLAAGCGVILLVLLTALAGVPIGTAGWLGVFLAVWATIFTLLRLKLPWVLVGLLVGIAIAGVLLLGRLWSS